MMRSPVKPMSLAFVVLLFLTFLLATGTARGEKFIPPVPDSTTLPANDDGADGCDSSRFSCVMGDEAVLDKQTGKVWARNTDILEKSVPWEEAVAFCADVQIGGKKGWRLPTRGELISLLDTSRSRPALPEMHPFTKINEIGYGGKGHVTYWTSNDYEGKSESAWMVSFNLGQVMDSLKLFDFKVWPVRDKQ